MDAALTLRTARHVAGVTQAELASRAGTSQATLSAYESGRKTPSLATLSRLLSVVDARLTVEPAPRVVRTPTTTEVARAGHVLIEALSLAEALPSRRARELTFPRLPT